MIENDVRRGREGTQPRAQLVSGASRKRMFFDQRDHFGDFAEYLFCGMAAGDPDVVIPNPFAVSESLRRPERHAPGLGHLPILLSDEIVDAGLSSLSCIERTDALVDFRAQCSQLLDVREQGPSDLFLILGGQPLYLGNGLFECFDHNHIIPDRTTQVRGRQRLAARRKSPCCRMATPRRAHSKALAAASLHDACFRPFLRPIYSPGGWRWASHSPTGSDPEGSSPNERGSGRSSASHSTSNWPLLCPHPEVRAKRASKGGREPPSFEARPHSGLAPQDEAE